MATVKKNLFFSFFFLFSLIFHAFAEFPNDEVKKDQSSKSIQDFAKPWIHSPNSVPRLIHKNNKIESREDKKFIFPKSNNNNNNRPVVLAIILGLGENSNNPQGVYISLLNGQIFQQQVGQNANLNQIPSHDQKDNNLLQSPIVKPINPKPIPIQDQIKDDKIKETPLNAEQIVLLPPIKKPKQRNPTKVANDEDAIFLNELEDFFEPKYK